jgi:glyoxylase-like metal-dependent hydrolase (beta-lactamase superfamily II)/rhodanese-related sulfurtransferase
MIIKQLNPHACKTYLVREEGSRSIALIDPVIDHVNDYIEMLKTENFKLEYVFDTHTHADHISGAGSMKDRTDCEYIMHEKAPAKCPGYRVKEGDTVEFGNLKMEVIETPGHTRDSISIIIGDNIFTGDALFLDDGGAGRDDLPGGDPSAHWHSLRKISELSENLMVYPAHDYRERKPSILSHQKQTNPHLKLKTEEAFVKYLEDLKLGPADWMKDVLKANYACAMDPNAAWIPADTPACEIKGTMDINANSQIVDTISQSELKKRIAAEDSMILLDVREPYELIEEMGFIDGCVNIPIGRFLTNLDALDEYKGKEIILICRSGSRAYTAGQILKQARFQQVKVLEGGMLTW